MSLGTIEFLDTIVCRKKHHWQSSRNIIFLSKYFSYFRYNDKLFFVRALFAACCNIIRASRETEKARLIYRVKS